ncbi:hypothetical protein ETB97_007176 [Aspergillus alliaceus]|uniref:Uncharacterized protein n=1 Tax=Petromyces alliaceus TaxID=209559 RepID=A0A8H6EAE6_PETAA|nr:hypothetical protein ETB97_007176 [Aspergillus burnettii]
MYLPWKLVVLIIKDLALALLEEGRISDVCDLLLVSRGARRVLEPLIYEEIHTDGNYLLLRDDQKATDARSPLLCRAILSRPELGAFVKVFSLEESEVSWSDAESVSSSEEPLLGPGELDAARSFVENKFSPIEFKKQWLEKITDMDEAAMQGLVLCQLPYLVSLTLKVHSGMFGHIGTFLRLPCLERLSFIVDMGNWKPWNNPFEQPEDILEHILSGTRKVKELVFEDNRNVYNSVTFNASKLKRILDQYVSQTVEDLSIVLTMNDERDWRLPQEFTRLSGVFGSMTHFTKLKRLSIQLELLLGRPSSNLYHLKDVLPDQLQHLTCFSIYPYDGADEERIWDSENYIPQFRMLANVARESGKFPLLSRVYMDRYRKDDFNKYSGHQPSSGEFTDDVLANSRVTFSWY